MKLTKGNEPLGLPEWMKFGLELEVENVKYSTVTAEAKKRGWHTDKDQSLTDSGVETVSPVLSENKPEVWKEVADICQIIKDNPNDERGAYTDHTCGGHIHFDSTMFRKNPEMMKNFMRLWAESEELVYKMCNDKNDPIRDGAMNTAGITMKKVLAELTKPSEVKVNSLRNLCSRAREIMRNATNANRKLNVLLSDALVSRNGMAAPIGAKIQKQLEAGKLKLGMPKNFVYRHTVGKVYRDVVAKQKLDPARYSGLNLTNLGMKKKNTIEFRASNGTMNPETIKENVFLYASVLNTAVEMTKNPELYQERLEEFYKRDVSEEEKATAFLGLVMDNPEDRQVYMDRWESVKDAPVFSAKGARNFAKGTFKKEEIQTIAEQTSGEKVKGAIDFVKDLRNRIMNKDKEEQHALGY